MPFGQIIFIMAKIWHKYTHLCVYLLLNNVLSYSILLYINGFHKQELSRLISKLRKGGEVLEFIWCKVGDRQHEKLLVTLLYKSVPVRDFPYLTLSSAASPPPSPPPKSSPIFFATSWERFPTRVDANPKSWTYRRGGRRRQENLQGRHDSV